MNCTDSINRAIESAQQIKITIIVKKGVLKSIIKKVKQWFNR